MSDLDKICNAIAASCSGLTPSLWLTRYGSISDKQLTEVRPQLRRDYLSTKRFYRSYVDQSHD